MGRRQLLMGSGAAGLVGVTGIPPLLTAKPAKAILGMAATASASSGFGTGLIAEMRARGLLDPTQPLTKRLLEDMEHPIKGVWEWSLGSDAKPDGTRHLFITVKTIAHSLKSDLLRIEAGGSPLAGTVCDPRSPIVGSDKGDGSGERVRFYCGGYSTVLQFIDNAAAYIATFNQNPIAGVNDNAFVASLLENCLGPMFNKDNVTRWLKEAAWDVPGFEQASVPMPGMVSTTTFLEVEDYATLKARKHLAVGNDGDQAVRLDISRRLHAPLQEIERQINEVRAKLDKTSEVHVPHVSLPASGSTNIWGKGVVSTGRALTDFGRSALGRIAEAVRLHVAAPLPDSRVTLPAIRLTVETEQAGVTPQKPALPQSPPLAPKRTPG